VTLTVAESMDDAVNDALHPVLELFPLPTTIGASMLFGGGRAFTLVRLLVPTTELLLLHSRVHELCLPHMPNGPLPHADPGHWTPHMTLARRVAPDQLQPALTLKSLRHDIRGHAVGLRHWDGNSKIEYPIR
jgi:hypothetical protein